MKREENLQKLRELRDKLSLTSKPLHQIDIKSLDILNSVKEVEGYYFLNNPTDLFEIVSLMNIIPTRIKALQLSLHDLEFDILATRKKLKSIEDELYLGEVIQSEKTIPQKEARLRLELEHNPKHQLITSELNKLHKDQKKVALDIDYLRETLNVLKKFHFQQLQVISFNKTIIENDLQGGTE